jgi:hypothetical protein
MWGGGWTEVIAVEYECANELDGECVKFWVLWAAEI